MMKLGKKVMLLTVAVISLGTAFAEGYQKKPRTIVVIFDGLRRDYITPALMPNLYKFRKEANYADDNHNVFPTVTRVNSPSYSTGSYPDKHGLMGNSLYVPSIGRVFQTGDAAQLMELDSLTHGRLVTNVSLGEILSEHGEEMYVFSSGSTGQAFLQNPKVKGRIINPALMLPATIRNEVIGKVGDPAKIGEEGAAGHKWITDAFFAFGLPESGPLVSSIWFSDPDGTEHRTGIGSPETLAALKSVDEQFGRIMDTLSAKGLRDKFNIIVATDHGFITYQGDQSLVNFLIEKGYKKDKVSKDVVVADGAIFVKDNDHAVIKAIVADLQKQPWIGPLFTKPKSGDPNMGSIPGTLSFEVFHWNHPERAADILTTYNWYDEPVTTNFRGVADNPGVAGHGGISLYEIRTPLLIAGPSFKKRYIDELPTSVIDIAPTLLDIYSIPVPPSMDGRVLKELYAGDQDAPLPKVEKQIISSKVKAEWGSYEMLIQQSTLSGHMYFDFGKVIRIEE